MENSRIKLLLFLSVLTMAVLPLLAAFYLLDATLETSLNLGFNPQIGKTLHDAARNLKTLKKADPENKTTYREQFEKVENLKDIYAHPELVRGRVLDSLKIYFGMGLIAAFLFSALIALTVSQRIARSYAVTFSDLLKQNERVRYLEEISSWQELAKMLAHEIKNPLTPIEVLVSTLSTSYHKKSDDDFVEQLRQTETMVAEELGHLKNIVNRFSEFAKLPKVDLVEENMVEVTARACKLSGEIFENASLTYDFPQQQQFRARIDAILFRQVITNIVRNGLEANPGKTVRFNVQLKVVGERMQISLANDGCPVPPEFVGRIFDPYVSEKKGKENMGLGLTIVKKIIIEHGGEIDYREEQGRPMFVISLRRIT